jgi:predicted CXXCH cytochrome family protein
MLAIMVASVIVAACAPESRHKVLTFFFTGVPPLEEENVSEVNHDVRQAAGSVQPRPLVSDGALYSHPLWVSGACNPCHETSSTFTIPGVERTSGTPFQSSGRKPGKLIRPTNTLCTHCHADKTTQRALNETLWLHNTVAKGECLSCHDPHQSSNPRQLRLKTAMICIVPCHVEGAYKATPAHQKEMACLECHNPHMGRNRNLLTAEYRERKIPVTDIPGHPEFGHKGRE